MIAIPGCTTRTVKAEGSPVEVKRMLFKCSRMSGARTLSMLSSMNGSYGSFTSLLAKVSFKSAARRWTTGVVHVLVHVLDHVRFFYLLVLECPTVGASCDNAGGRVVYKIFARCVRDAGGRSFC